MNTSTYDFVSVEMRGLKAALVARAQAQRVSVSELVRSAVAPGGHPKCSTDGHPNCPTLAAVI